MEFIRDKTPDKPKRLLIVGAGGCGRILIEQIKVRPDCKYEPVVFVDDNPSLLNTAVDGIKIAGTTKDIPTIAREYDLDWILIAIPTITGEQLRRIMLICQETDLPVKIIPGLLEALDLHSKHVTPGGKIREIKYEDLIKRKPAIVDLETIRSLFRDKTVLVTGASGTIGSELCDVLSKLSLKKLIMFDHDELGIYDSINKFKEHKNIEFVIGTIRDVKKLEKVFDNYKPEFVFHAAAYKHIHLSEWNPDEAVKTNISGTLNLVDVSKKFNVERFIFISTDKAANPSSVMGATKRIGELIMTRNNAKTKFVSVRFGNVVGSRGSVIPLFRKQIESKKEVTITHPDMSRYFMLTSEAAWLVIQAAALDCNGGEIFVLDMGEPIKITDMVNDIVKLSGLKKDDVKIKYIGIRPGEKITEELFNKNEKLNVTKHERISVTHPINIDTNKLTEQLNALNSIADSNDNDSISTKVMNIVSEFDMAKNYGKYTSRDNCRFCKSKDVVKFLDLGYMPLAGAFLTKDKIPEENVFPLHVYFCKNCKLVQLLDLVDPEVLFKDYFYLSSAAQTTVNHFKQYAQDLRKRLPGENRFLVEIGSNDGVLLSPLKDLSIKTLGVEPANNIASIAKEKDLDVINDFFNNKIARDIKEKYGQADAISANNVFAHIDDIDEITQGIKTLLKPNGFFVFEVHYLLELINKLQYDTIYHEHFSYYSILALANYFKQFDMEIFDVTPIPVHAGSIRVYVRNKNPNSEISENVKNQLKKELDAGLDKLETYTNFAEKVKNHKNNLRKLLLEIKAKGGSIIGYGAPGRGNTLLNYCEISSKIIDYSVDGSPRRQNVYTPGTHIPIFSPHKLKETPPTHALMVAWSYKDEILKKEVYFIKNGGQFIMPLPEIKILTTC